MKTVIFLFLVLLGIILFFYNRHKRLFSYNTQQDYAFELNETVQLTLTNGQLHVPEEIAVDSTLILKATVQSTLKGWYFMPSVRFQTASKQNVQSLEYGAKGVRYFNISHLISEDDRTIRFSGKNINIPNQTVELAVYRNESFAGKKILIVAPHPDDAELAAYGVYSEHAEQSCIVTVTAGDSGSFHYSNLYNRKDKADCEKQYITKGQIRVWNSIHVPQWAGVPSEQVLNFGYFDSALDAMQKNPEQEIPATRIETADVGIFRKGNRSEFAKGLSGGSTWNDLIANMVYVLETFQPDVIITTSPNLDSNKDHQLCAIAVMEAARKIAYTRGSLMMCAIHYIYDDYPLGKMGDVLSLPPKFGEPCYFRSIRSYPLEREVLCRKLLALDAMNDVRPNAASYGSWKVGLFRSVNALRHHVLNIERDLLNRFTRSNELFYVVPMSDVHQDDIYRQLSYRCADKTHR